MPRPARFDEDAIVDAALRLVARGHGPARLSVEAIAAEMGGNVGSIYYRFPSRDHVLAELWIRCAHAGQAGLLVALAGEDLPAALADAVLHYPRWARRDLAAARVLAAYGREQLMRRWPEDLGEALGTVNDAVVDAVRTFTRRWYGDARREHRQTATFALLDLPAAAIRRYLLAGRPPPPSLDAAILQAARAALGPPVGGDRAGASRTAGTGAPVAST